MMPGKVFLVGAGPGDVGLITVKGLEAIKKAEVILYDRLANPKLLDFAPSDCEFIYCGKLPDRHILRQENINDLLVEKAQEGKVVVRLKGGDPGVFGRVGEEAEALVQHDIPFEIVPGITSGIAAPLYAGIPVTHREYGESFGVVTAHDKSAEGKPNLDWEGLSRGLDTIAFYMGVRNLPYICENLILHGKPATTPVILIQWGTFGRQKTLQGTLENIAAKVLEANFKNPAIILVGDVVSLREKINWFEKKPLYGRQILLARTGVSPSGLAMELMDQGADVIEFPKWKKTILPLDLSNVVTYKKILFTSPESVDEFFTGVIEQQIDIRKITADFYGASTKSVHALKVRGFMASLVEGLKDSDDLLVVGDGNVEGYKSANVWITSQKVLDLNYFPIFKRMIGDAKMNTLVFPSSASVNAFMVALKECEIEASTVLENVEIISMGKQTLEAVEQAGLSCSGLPNQPTKESLVEYLKQGERENQ